MLGNFSLGSIFTKYLPFIIAVSIITVIIYIVVRVFYWVVFKKAGIKPIYSIVPILNYIKLIEMAELPKSMIFLLFIPIANVIAICRIKYEVSIRFGKGAGFAVIYALFPIVALYLLLPSNVVYNKIVEQYENKLEMEEKNDDDDVLKDFKPEIKPGSVPFEETAIPYFEEKPVDLNVELKTFELESDNVEQKNEVVEEEKVEEVKRVVNPVPIEQGTVPHEEPKDDKVVDVAALLNTEAQTHPSNGDVVQIKKCPNCGTELESDLSICFMCGKNV